MAAAPSPLTIPAPILDFLESKPVGWMAESHVFTTQAAKSAFRRAGVAMIDTCLSEAWPFFYDRDPADGLRVLRRDHVACPYGKERHGGLGEAFANEYRDFIDSTVDFFWVSFLAFFALVFEPTGRPVLLNMSFRWEGAVPPHDGDERHLWAAIQEHRSNGRLRITASNAYDREYYRYFSGEEVPVVSLIPDYVPRWDYDPAGPVLVGPHKQPAAVARRAAAVTELLMADNHVRNMATAFPSGFTFAELTRARAIVLIPYSVYTGVVMEWLAMGIPVLVPTPELLTRWHLEDYLLDERKCAREANATAGRVGASTGMPDPNLDDDPEAVRFWLEHCDWYRWPVIQFSSLEDLHERLRVLDPPAASADLHRFTAAERLRSDAALAAELAGVGIAVRPPAALPVVTSNA